MFPALTSDERLTLKTTSLSTYGGNFDLCQLSWYQFFVVKKKKRRKNWPREDKAVMSFRVSDSCFSIPFNWGLRKRFFKKLWDRPCLEQGQEWKRRVQNRSKIAYSLFPFTERENMKTNSTCFYEEVNRFCLENHRKLAAFHQNRYRNVITHCTNHLASDRPTIYFKFWGSSTLGKIWAKFFSIFFCK